MPDNKKPKGKVNAYSYFVKASSDEHKRRYPQEKLVFKDFSQQCAAKWRELDAKSKQHFIEQAEKDKIRFEKEMKNFVPNDQENKTTRNSKGAAKSNGRAKKDPNAPKRPLSAYILFSNDMRQQVRNENPEVKMNEILKILGTRWKEASASVKARYEGLAAKAKQRYEVELAEYKTNGRTPLSAKSPNKTAKGKAQSKNVVSKKKQPEVQKEESESEESESEESEEESDDEQKSKDVDMNEESSGDEESD